MNGDPRGGPPEGEALGSGWEAVLDDMAATAEAYRERGWTALELHPGDSVLVDSESRTGLDVVLPGHEFERLEALVEEAAFTDVDVFRAEGDGLCYLLIVERSPDSESAVLVPAYYDPGGSQPKVESIRDDGVMTLYCRHLDDDYVAFRHDDVGPFLPEPLAEE